MNQLERLNEQSGISTFKYDNNGNLEEIKKNNSIISKYEYDVRNQLTVAKDGQNNTLASFDYDFERKRTSKVSAGNTTNYTYAGSQVVSESSSLYGNANYTIGAGEIVKSEFGASEVNYHYSDALGSVTSIANTQGSLTSRNEYNAWGEATPSGNLTANSIGYTGQRLDSETGLMALGNGERYYSPNYARFIQQDSFSGRTMSPQTMNRFAYANGNPNKYVDPSGNDGVIADGIRNNLMITSAGAEDSWAAYTWNFGVNFFGGAAYDSINLSTAGAFGMADRNLQKAMRGEQITVSDLTTTNWYGGNQDGWNPGNILKNEAIGFATGAYKLVTGLASLAIEYNPVTQAYRAFQFVMDPVGESEKRRQAAFAAWAGIKQWASDLYGGVTNPSELLKAADELGADKTSQILGEAQFDAWMIVDGGIGAVKGAKAINAMRAAKLERQATQVAIREAVETSAAQVGSKTSEVSAAASKSTGKIAAESAEITKESVVRALRQSNTVEGAATAKLIKRGKIELRILESVPNSVAKQVGTNIRGYKESMGNTVNIIRPNLSSVRDAAGITAHETKHWLQIRAGQSASSKLSEFEAFQWSMRVDGTTYPRTTSDIYDMVNNHPIYKNKQTFGWTR